MFCDQCGHTVTSNAKFCTRCGAPLAVAQGSSQADPSVTPSPTSSNATSDVPVVAGPKPSKSSSLKDRAISSPWSLPYLPVLFFASHNLVGMLAIFPTMAAMVPLGLIRRKWLAFAVSLLAYLSVHLACVAYKQVVDTAGSSAVTTIRSPGTDAGKPSVNESLNVAMDAAMDAQSASDAYAIGPSAASRAADKAADDAMAAVLDSQKALDSLPARPGDAAEKAAYEAKRNSWQKAIEDALACEKQPEPSKVIRMLLEGNAIMAMVSNTDGLPIYMILDSPLVFGKTVTHISGWQREDDGRVVAPFGVGSRGTLPRHLSVTLVGPPSEINYTPRVVRAPDGTISGPFSRVIAGGLDGTGAGTTIVCYGRS